MSGNAALRHLRLLRGWGQADVADRLNELARRAGKSSSVTEGTVGRWERGRTRMPDPLNRQLLAELFGVPLDVLGYADQSRSSTPLPDVYLSQHVRQSQEDWRAVRQHLNANRAMLTMAAGRLHAAGLWLGDTGTLSRQDWRPPAPVDLGSITLRWTDPSAPEVDGREPQTEAVRPLAAEGRRYLRYSHALREVDPPALLENRLGYRLLDVDWNGDHARLTFGLTTYFEHVDVAEALAHELARVHLAEDGGPGRPLAWRELPFRRLVGDPFDLARRALLPSIDTLTLRRTADSASFLLHERDPRRVAVAGGLRHVVPAGVFQPASITASPWEHDFDLWRSVMREYSEELLGNADHDGSGPPIRYDADEPFRTLDEARRNGRLRAYCFGIGLDALTLSGEILTVVALEDDVFDHVFAGLVSTNSEGEVLSAVDAAGRTQGVPFTEPAVRDLLTSGSLAPAAAACLRLAWAHRDILLA
jgi:transcriptional regulator with XRE-family HTH domain